LTARYVELSRDTGALTELSIALSIRSGALVFAGELAEAASLIEEAESISEAIGSHFPPYAALVLAAWRGREAEAAELIAATTDYVSARGEGYALDTADWARALLCNGLGRYEEALAAAQRASEHHQDIVASSLGLVELILAAARTGKSELAADALERLSEITGASGSDWALGTEARSRALVSDGEVAEGLYREAIERLGRTRVRVELARAHLHYGEWLRREGRRLDARVQLQSAHEMLTAIGMEAFAERARIELLATGEKVRKRLNDTRDQLTPQEAQIARLARDGLSNPEIGARLFISARTVEWHLRKVFAKLGISSRRELRAAFPEESRLLASA
jgi:ATP/maltotriose-dependent transcriptional regulator MalT